jgi:tetratricopeptide (TPR) repeat protein
VHLAQSVAVTLTNLASLYDTQARFADAEPLIKRSLTIEEKTLGPDHPAVAASLTALAILYQNQGRYTDAEHLYKEALAIGMIWAGGLFFYGQRSFVQGLGVYVATLMKIEDCQIFQSCSNIRMIGPKRAFPYFE